MAEMDPPPEFLVETHEVLSARAGIARYGVDGWLRLARAEPSVCLLDALDLIESEISRLERESEMSRTRTPAEPRKARTR